MKKILITLATLFFISGVQAQEFKTINQDSLIGFLEETHKRENMPGLRAAIRYPNGQIIRASTGYANRELEIVLNDTIGMPGGSTGKTFVAVLTMMLIQEGVLSIDDPISLYVGNTSWFKQFTNGENIKIKHLLSHSSGVRDYPATIAFTLKMIWRVIRHGSAKFSPEELIQLVQHKKPRFDPGRGFGYTDAGYIILGRVIESATGESYYDLLNERILKAHNLTKIHAQDESIMKNVAMGYMANTPVINKEGQMKLDPSSEWTGGGLITNPTMLVEFYGKLVDGEMIERELFQKMISGGWKNPDTPNFHYGYGLFVYKDGESFGHGGLWPGYRTHVAHFSESGITVAIQTNRDGSIDMLDIVISIHEMAKN